MWRSKLYKLSEYLSPLTIPVDLIKSQWWSYKELEDFQNDRLRKMVIYAYHTIPGYKKKFDQAGVKPRHIRTKKDLRYIPIIERTELQNNPDFVNKWRISATLRTGGSTGTPLQYYDSKESYAVRNESHLRGWSWNGYTPGQKLAVIAGSQGIIKQKNILTLSGNLDSNELEKNIAALRTFKPAYMRGYVGSLFILAKYCLDNGFQLEGIKSVDPISENLYEYQRKVMKKAFNCEVFEEYCCNDGGACAWECNAHEGLHYFMERAIIEEIDGEMIVTGLWNTAMPFIRYRNGDAVTFLQKECSCGRKLTLIKVKGRKNDIIITPKGPVGATFFMMRAIRYDANFRSGIRMAQYIQKPHYKLTINIVKNTGCTNREVEEFKRDILKITPGMNITIKFVHDIPTSKKGKRSFIINEDKQLLRKWQLL